MNPNEPNQSGPTPEEVFNIDKLIEVLKERMGGCIKARDHNSTSIDNLGKIITALETIE
jgi:hypothetical protein